MNSGKTTTNRKTIRLVVTTLLFLFVETAHSAEFEKLGKAISKALGTKKAFQKKVKVKGQEVQVFYNKKKGKATKFAVVQKRIYEPDCTHTWVIGLDAKKSTVREIRVVEMSCPHAFPTRKASFLEQYSGVGPKGSKALKSKIVTIAKATGSSELTTDAVQTAIEAANKLRGKI